MSARWFVVVRICGTLAVVPLRAGCFNVDNSDDIRWKLVDKTDVGRRLREF